MREKELTEKILLKETKFQGKIFDTQLWEVELPNGKKGQREAVIHSGGVCAFALREDGKVPLVKQHRVVAGEILWELPAGKKEKNENSLAAIQRELEEETGLKAANWEKLISFYPTPAYCSEIIDIYLATTTFLGRQCLDLDEFLEVDFFDIEEISNMIKTGKIKDGKTLVGIFLAIDRLKNP